MQEFPISSWYPLFGNLTFPTVFVQLTKPQCSALAEGTQTGSEVDDVVRRLNDVIKQLPGSAYVHADVCAPTDSDLFGARASVRTGARAWKMLVGSEKVRTAFREGRAVRLGLHSYRRMDPVKEFRIFIKDSMLVGMSQIKLERHYRRLEGRRELLWSEAQKLVAEVTPFLPASDLTFDVYLTSAGGLLLIDLNPWGPPTDPLLMRKWDIDWSETIGLRLIPPPTKLSGDVEVSF